MTGIMIDEDEMAKLYWEWRELGASAMQLAHAAEGCGDYASTLAHSEQELCDDALLALRAIVPPCGWRGPCGQMFHRVQDAGWKRSD